MRNKPAHTIEEVLAAIEKGFTRTGAAKVLGVSRQTVVRYGRRWKAVNDLLDQKKRELVDYGQMSLRTAVLNGDPWAVQFVLKTLGKDEGYVERQEVTGRDGTPLIPIKEIIIKLPNEEQSE